MHDNNSTTLTKRGQISIPAWFRKKAGLRPGQEFVWVLVNEGELRLTLKRKDNQANPFAALGYARRFKAEDKIQRSDQVLRDLRDGEED